MAEKIPIMAARRIAEEYGYDQVLIMARKVDSKPGAADGEEWMTTYGVDRDHCDAVARIRYWLEGQMKIWADPARRRVAQRAPELLRSLKELVFRANVSPEDEWCEKRALHVIAAAEDVDT